MTQIELDVRQLETSVADTITRIRTLEMAVDALRKRLDALWPAPQTNPRIEKDHR